MLSHLTEEGIEFMELFYNPIAFSECTFPNFDNLGYFEEEKFGHVRLGQFTLLSYEYMIADDPKLAEKKNFKLKEKAGTSYVLGGRNFGKTACEKLDICQSIACLDGYPTGITSYDSVHIRGVMEPVIDALNNHPIFNMFYREIKKSPTYLIRSSNNMTLEGINMNLLSKSPGNQFFQKHFKKLWVEEASFETEEVYKKRIDSRHEFGCIERITGMCNFTKYMPAGKTFYDKTKHPLVINLPQYINPFWDETEKQKAAKKHGGINSVGYRTFVCGEVAEEGVSVFDMERIRPFYKEGRSLKLLEITKSTFPSFEDILIVERPNNAEQIYICADIGETASTQIAVLSKTNGKYKYLYEITLYSLTDKEQTKIFKYLINTLKANVIGLDTTDGTGRAIFRSLEETYPKENLIWVAFNEKIAVDFLRDENNRVIFQEGVPVHVEEFISSWSVKHLKDILYDGKVEIPEDAYKFDLQVNSVISLISGTRALFECNSEEDHVFQSFQVFSICDWMNEFNLVKSANAKKFCKTGV